MFRQITRLFLGLRVPRTGILLISLLVVGCNSDPYEGVVLSPQKAEGPRDVPLSYTVYGEDSLIFTEGTEGSYFYRFHVPGGGDPVVEILSPPEEGFHFDENQSKIIWTPSFKAADDPFDFTETKRIYNPVILRLSSSEDHLVYHDFKMIVIVQDRPQNFLIEGEDTLEITENVPFVYPFRIINDDFPSSEHRVFFPTSFIDRLLGSSMSQKKRGDNTSWSIDMTLPIDFMNPNDLKLDAFFRYAAASSYSTTYGCTRTYNGCQLSHALEIKAVAPNGRSATKKINLIIKEQREPPVVSIMEDTAIQRNGTLYFRVSDPNKEIVPFVNLVDEGRPHIIDYPTVGVNHSIEDNVAIEIKEAGLFEAVVLVHIKNIPIELVGKKLGMQFGTCNYDYNGDTSPYNSKNHTVNIGENPEVAAKRCDNDKDPFLSTTPYTENSKYCYYIKKIPLNSYIDYKQQKNCVLVDLAVPIIDPELPSPHFVREQWPLGTTYYVRANQKEIIDLPIYESMPLNDVAEEVFEKAAEEVSETDLEAPQMIVTHHIDFFDGAQSDEVSWKNGQLIINAKTPGDKSFTITAVNNSNTRAHSLFSLKVFPEDWSPVLIATGNLHGVEAQKTLDLLQLRPRDHWDITLNEDQFVDLKLRDFMVWRDTLIIGSDALRQEESHLAALDRSRKNFKNIIIATSSIEKLPAGLRGEIEENGLYTYANYKDIFSPARADYVPISELVFETDVRGFFLTRPNGEVSLAGSFNAESSNPMTLTSSFTECKVVLQLKHKSNASYRFPMAFQCPRGEGGYLVLIGFDILDFHAPDDPGLIKIWLEQMIKE